MRRARNRCSLASHCGGGRFGVQRRDYDRACNWHRSLHVWGNVRHSSSSNPAPPARLKSCPLNSLIASPPPSFPALRLSPDLTSRRRQQRHPLHGAPGRRRRRRRPRRLEAAAALRGTRSAADRRTEAKARAAPNGPCRGTLRCRLAATGRPCGRGQGYPRTRWRAGRSGLSAAHAHAAGSPSARTADPAVH